MRIARRELIAQAGCGWLASLGLSALPAASARALPPPSEAHPWKRTIVGSGPTAMPTTDGFEILFPANSRGADFSAGYRSPCLLVGDFDIQVDYALIDWSTANGVRVGIVAVGHGSLHRVALGINEATSVRDRESYFYGVNGGHRVGTPDRAGSFRLQRTGDTYRGYVLNTTSSQWAQIGTSGAWGAPPLQIGLEAWSHSYAFAGQPVRMAFRNFRINTGSQLCPATLAGLEVSRGTVNGGQAVTAMVSLSEANPDEETVVSLTSTNAAAIMPLGVAVPAGATTATFRIDTRRSRSTSVGIITATLGDSEVHAALAVLARR